MASSFLLFFPFAFLTTPPCPQEALTGWLATIADYNPVTYLLEGLRSLNEGWDAGELGQGDGCGARHGRGEHVDVLRRPARPHGSGMNDELQAATELLEAVAADRSLLHGLSEADRIRFLNAVADVFCPDPLERRRQVKALRQRQRAERVQRDESVLADTAIRRLRAKPVYTTPNVFPPDDIEPGDAPLVDGVRGPRAPALLRVQGRSTTWCTPSTTSSARRAPSSTSASAPRPPTCGAGWRSSPAGG